MKLKKVLLLPFAAALLVACSEPAPEESAPAGETANQAANAGDAGSAAEPFEITPGLTARILRAGDGEAAEAGDSVEVHYTGWLYDPEADQNRGQKFDSSVDRGQRFRFPLGAGRVIKGWDQGVAGMKIGEVRELTIAPGMGYGDRGAGNVIPPGATLVFEVELFAADSLSEAATN
jgi:FKBP-type peptidyl-prolyl cis-trans isomerase FkpA